MIRHVAASPKPSSPAKSVSRRIMRRTSALLGSTLLFAGSVNAYSFTGYASRIAVRIRFRFHASSSVFSERLLTFQPRQGSTVHLI